MLWKFPAPCVASAKKTKSRKLGVFSEPSYTYPSVLKKNGNSLRLNLYIICNNIYIYIYICSLGISLVWLSEIRAKVNCNPGYTPAELFWKNLLQSLKKSKALKEKTTQSCKVSDCVPYTFSGNKAATDGTKLDQNSVVVSDIFYFHPYLGK